MKATERSFLYLYDKIRGGQFALASPYSKFCGLVPLLPVIYAHVYHRLLVMPLRALL